MSSGIERPVDHEVVRPIRLSGDHEAAGLAGARSAAGSSRLRQIGEHLLFCLRVNVVVHLGELEQVLAVVASELVVVGRGRQSEIRLARCCFGREVI